MNDPWKILQIEPTTDPEEIKKAYRALAQKYHPDKAKTPEKVRKYTVLFVEIRRAYEVAMQYAEHQATTPGKAAPAPTSWARSGGAVSWREWVKAAFVLVAGITGIVLLAAVGIYARSFPESHLFPITFIVVVGICSGYFVGFLLFGLQMLLYAPIQFGILEKIGLGKYADKLGWTLSVLLWLFVISLIGVPELNVRQVGNAVIWFVALGVGPVFGLGTWIMDYVKFKKVKGHYLEKVRPLNRINPLE